MQTIEAPKITSSTSATLVRWTGIFLCALWAANKFAHISVISIITPPVSNDQAFLLFSTFFGLVGSLGLLGAVAYMLQKREFYLPMALLVAIDTVLAVVFVLTPAPLSSIPVPLTMPLGNAAFGVPVGYVNWDLVFNFVLNAILIPFTVLTWRFSRTSSP